MSLSYAELQKEFGEGNVSKFFDTEEHTWELHESCKDAQSGEFVLKHFDKIMTNEEAIQWGLDNGYRPATHEELVKWHQVNRENRNFVIALGSFMLDGGYQNTAYIHTDFYYRRFLESGRNDLRFCANYWILFVRITTSTYKQITIWERLQRIEEEIKKIKEMI